MLSLAPVPFEAIQGWIEDFKRRSKNLDNLPHTAELIGIFSDKQLAGYFIVTGYQDKDLEINHGYLSKDFRHKRLSALAMQLLEQKARKAGFNRIILASSRTLKAYTKFMHVLGYVPARIIYEKAL